jgi:hypothetical protein
MEKALLYLEYYPDQIFYVNGFKTDVISPHLIGGDQPLGLYGLYQDFDSIFRKTTTLPATEKFYYPVIASKWSFTDIFSEIAIESSVVEKIKNGQGKILLINPYEGWTWSWWDTLAKVLKGKFNIEDIHIVFLTANYLKHDTIKTIVFNTWERQIHSNYSSPDHYERCNESIGNYRPYKFICLNRRPSIHRYAVVSNLFDIKDQGILTCATTGSYNDNYQKWVEDNFLDEYPELSNKYIGSIKPILPLTYNDGINPEVDNPAANEWGKVDKYFLSYLYIVTETYFEGKAQGSSTLFLSEKIFKPIIFFQPFIAFARPGTLKLLHSLGYKTFNNYIDESYDEIENDKERLLKAVASARAFINLPKAELKQLMIKMTPIFQHNYNHLKLRHDVEIYEELKRDLHTGLHS